jgi:hypothetical protein
MTRGVAGTWLAALSAGWVVMALQLMGGRLLAPVFGQTIHQWGALIGATLACMTAGYWTGGRWGGVHRLPWLLALGALWAAGTPWLGRDAAALAEDLAGPLGGALLAALVLLGPPSFALAAVSPLCVARLAQGGDAGRASGTVSALGAVGSIGGTFFGAFLAVPWLGLAGGYAVAAGVAALAAVLVGLAPRHAVLVLLPLLPGWAAQRDFAAGFVELHETPYNTILLADSGEALVLSVNSPEVVQSMHRHDGAPTGAYWDALALAPALAEAPGAAPRVLFLGVAGGAAVAAASRVWPAMRAEGVEIDPGIVDVARRRLGLSIPVAVADARRYVAGPGEAYDAILIDLYATGQVPVHVATAEFFAAVAARLAPGGVVAMNVYGAGMPGEVTAPLAATLGAAFAAVLAAELEGGNTLLLAWREPVTPDQARARLARHPGTEALAAAIGLPDPSWRAARVLTDDRSDLELRAARALSSARGR